MSNLPARTGLDWLKQGFAVFRQQPGILTMLLFGNLFFSLLISALPLAGPMVAIVLIPSFSMAIMQACNLITQGQRVLPAVLLTGFRKPAVIALCKLGLLYLGIFFVLALLMKISVGDDFMKTMTSPVDPKKPPTVAAGDMMNAILVLLLQGALLTTLCFAAPLTYWKKMSLFKATFYSVFGVFGAIKPMLVMLLSWFAMFMLACMVAMLIFSGAINIARMFMVWLSLLFILVLQCSIYAAYRQIFADPAPDTEPVSLAKHD